MNKTISHCFWTYMTFALRRGPLIAALILPVEFLIVGFCPNVQIFGQNPWRTWLAEHLFSFLPGQAPYHLAGAMTDFKKMIVYLFLGGQLVMTRFLVLAHSKHGATSSQLPSNSESVAIVRNLLRWRGSFAYSLGILLYVLLVLFYWKMYLTPDTTCHVLGPPGKGLIANNHPAISCFGRIAIILYRLWYLAAMSFVGIAVFYVIPGHLRLAFSRSPEINKPMAYSMGPALVHAIFVPGLCLVLLLTAWSLTRNLGVGELGGLAGDVALVAGIVFGLWLLMGLIAVVRFPQTQGVGPVERFIRALRTTWNNPDREFVKVVVGFVGCVLFGTLISIGTVLRSTGPEPDQTLKLASSATLSTLVEFMHFSPSQGRAVFAAARQKVAKMVRNDHKTSLPPQELRRQVNELLDASHMEKWFLSDSSVVAGVQDDHFVDLLTIQVVVRSMLSVVNDDDRLSNPLRKKFGSDWHLAITAADLKANSIRQLFFDPSDNRRKGYFYDPVFLNCFRMRQIYELILRLESFGVDLLPLSDSGSPNTPLIQGMRRIVDEVASQVTKEVRALDVRAQ